MFCSEAVSVARLVPAPVASVVSLSGASSGRQQQLALFQATAELHPVVTRLREMDVERVTPIEALNLLASLKREADT